MDSSLKQPPEPRLTENLSAEPIQPNLTILPITTSPSPAPTVSHHAETTPQSAPSSSAHDEGYVPRGSHRELNRGKWEIVTDKYKAPRDVYGDAETFPEENATVQIVTFFMNGYVGRNLGMRAKWENPVTSKEPVALRNALSEQQEPKTWRWIHCEGLHGPTMKIIAEKTSGCLPS
jgi:hypothetical protein